MLLNCTARNDKFSVAWSKFLNNGLQAAETLRSLFADVVAHLDGGKWADVVEYKQRRAEVMEAAEIAGYSDGYAKKVLTLVGFTLTNPDHKPRGTKGGRKTKSKGKPSKSKARKSASPADVEVEVLTVEETAILTAWRTGNLAEIQAMLDARKAETAAKRARV